MFNKSVFWRGEDGFDPRLLTRDTVARCKFNPHKSCFIENYRALEPAAGARRR